MARTAILQQFYSSREWQAFRAAIIAERGLACEACGKVIALLGDASVHHIHELTPENIHDVLITLNPDNVMVLHRDCHDKIHGRFIARRDKQVYLVYGMPLSGKSTFVSQQMRRWDLLVDMNLLYAATSGLPLYDKPDNLFPNVRAVYNLLVDQVKTRYGKWFTAWIVGGFPEKSLRERLADELGAELVYCDCTREEALARLEKDEARRGLRDEYTRYIDEWLEKFAP